MLCIVVYTGMVFSVGSLDSTCNMFDLGWGTWIESGALNIFMEGDENRKEKGEYIGHLTSHWKFRRAIGTLTSLFAR